MSSSSSGPLERHHSLSWLFCELCLGLFGTDGCCFDRELASTVEEAAQV